MLMMGHRPGGMGGWPEIRTLGRLDKARLSIDDVTARTLEQKLDSFERLDRSSPAPKRRNNALHEI